MALKAVLRLLAVEYPREHDVGEVLVQVKGRLPADLRGRLNGIVELSAELARVREPALYGYEREGIPARRAFSREYAENVHGRVEEIVKLCSKFVGSATSDG